jgi:hypothetical protein
MIASEEKWWAMGEVVAKEEVVAQGISGGSGISDGSCGKVVAWGEIVALGENWWPRWKSGSWGRSGGALEKRCLGEMWG